jgi:ribose transport system substrate-binding protein
LLSDEEALQRAGEQLGTPHSRRVFLSLAAAAGAAVVLPACGSSSPTSTGKAATAAAAGAKKTGLVVDQVPTLANSFYASWGKGYESSAGQFGLKTKTYNPNFQASKELAQAQGLKGEGAAMLVGIAGDQAQVPTIARTCQRSGIYYNPCFEDPAWFTPQDVGEFYVSFLTPRSEEGAYQTAKFLFEQVGGEGDIIHIQGQPGPTDTFRTLGVKRAAKEAPGIKLVGNQPADWTLDGGRKVMLNMLSAHPGAKGVFAQNDSIALGVLSVLKERGNKDMKVVGMDAIPEILPELQKATNFVGTFNSLGYWIAGYAVVNVFDALNGWKPSTPERLMASGGILITQDNVADLKAKIYDASKPFDWALMSRTMHPKDWDPQFDVQPVDPNVLWAAFPKDRPLNAAWNGSADAIKGQQQTYQQHYKTGPLKGL